MEREKRTPSDPPEAAAPDRLSGTCGWCGRGTWFSRRAAAWAGFMSFQSGPGLDYRPRVVGIYQCGGCENASLLVWTAFAYSGWNLTLEHQWPEEQALEMEDIPDSLQADRMEAMNCLFNGQHRASLLMARATLQRAVRILLAEEDGVLDEKDKGSLFSELDLLVERKIITPQLRRNVDEVRLSGNDVAHPEELGEVTQVDARDSLIFLEDFLTTTIAVPARQQKRLAARQASADEES